MIQSMTARLDQLEAALKTSEARVEQVEACRKVSDAKVILVESQLRSSEAKIEELHAKLKASEAQVGQFKTSLKASDDKVKQLERDLSELKFECKAQHNATQIKVQDKISLSREENEKIGQEMARFKLELTKAKNQMDKQVKETRANEGWMRK